MTYLKNVWYLAGLEADLDETPLVGRTIIEEPVLLFKDENGVISAIGDRCPHRFAPLHLGKVKGTHVECPYHGLQFDKTGACVHNPHGDGKIAAGSKVKSYPLVARDTILWIWMGAPELADPSKIPDYSIIGRSAPATRMAMPMYVKCNYELLTDNILDLTHADYVHVGLLGGGALTKATPRVWEDGDALSIEWVVKGGVIVPLMKGALADPSLPDSEIDSWISVRWEAPASMLLETGIAPAGTPREEAATSHALHIMTPANERESYYLAYATRNFHPTAQMTEILKEQTRIAFMDQDKPMLEAQQNMMGTPDLWSLKPVLLPGDVGAVRVRRMLERMIKEEQAAA